MNVELTGKEQVKIMVLLAGVKKDFTLFQLPHWTGFEKAHHRFELDAFQQAGVLQFALVQGDFDFLFHGLGHQVWHNGHRNCRQT